MAGAFRKIVGYRHLILRYDDWVHLCVPFAIANGIEDVHFLALSLSIHAAFHFGSVRFIDYIL